jgi:hypothetical protein
MEKKHLISMSDSENDNECWIDANTDSTKIEKNQQENNAKCGESFYGVTNKRQTRNSLLASPEFEFQHVPSSRKVQSRSKDPKERLSRLKEDTDRFITYNF